MGKKRQCEVCGNYYERLGRHVSSHGLTQKEYYLKYVGEKEFCPICGNECKFVKLSHGYNSSCGDPDCFNKLKDTSSYNSALRRYDNPVEARKVYDEKRKEHSVLMKKRHANDTHYKNGYSHFCVEWWIDKYGEEEGRKKYKEFQIKQASKPGSGWTMDNLINKYGQDEARKRFSKYVEEVVTSTTFYSEISQELFWELYDRFSLFHDGIFFAELNKEYYLTKKDESEQETLFFVYDFTIVDKNKIIEFNGDFWHANPAIYKSDELVYNNKKASDVWEFDQKKQELAKEKGFDLMVIWEKDYRDDKQQTILQCEEWLNK